VYHLVLDYFVHHKLAEMQLVHDLVQAFVQSLSFLYLLIDALSYEFHKYSLNVAAIDFVRFDFVSVYFVDLSVLHVKDRVIELELMDRHE
jgi:hypothetical protein